MNLKRKILSELKKKIQSTPQNQKIVEFTLAEVADSLYAYHKSVSREFRKLRQLKIVDLKCVDKLAGVYHISIPNGRRNKIIEQIESGDKILAKVHPHTQIQEVRDLLEKVRNGAHSILPAVPESGQVKGEG